MLTWNVEGIDFYAKHTFLETQFGQLDEIIDSSVAERIRTLGHYSPATIEIVFKFNPSD